MAEGAGGGKGRALIEPPIEQSHLATTVAFYVHNLYISFDISLLIYVCLYVCLSACMCDCVCACVRVCVYIKQHSGSVCLFIVASVAVVVRNRNSICSSMFPFGLVWFGLVSLCHLMTMLEVAIYIACRLTNCQQQFKSISPKEREAKMFAVLSSNTSKVF